MKKAAVATLLAVTVTWASYSSVGEDQYKDIECQGILGTISNLDDPIEYADFNDNKVECYKRSEKSIQVAQESANDEIKLDEAAVIETDAAVDTTAACEPCKPCDCDVSASNEEASALETADASDSLLTLDTVNAAPKKDDIDDLDVKYGLK